jgi:hypothetical protein
MTRNCHRVLVSTCSLNQDSNSHRVSSTEYAHFGVGEQGQ